MPRCSGPWRSRRSGVVNAEMQAKQARLAAEVLALNPAAEHRAALLRSVSHDLRPAGGDPGGQRRPALGGRLRRATRDELLDVVADEAERLDRLVGEPPSAQPHRGRALEPDSGRDSTSCRPTGCGASPGWCATRRSRRHVPPGLPLVDADYTLVDQVVTNLLENAVRHSPPHAVRVERQASGRNRGGLGQRPGPGHRPRRASG